MLFKEIVSSSVSGEGITSKELNDKLEIPRTTVIYHLNRFIGSGLVVRKGCKYQLRSNDMKDTIEELQSDMLHEFNKTLEFAERFDKILQVRTLAQEEKPEEQEQVKENTQSNKKAGA